MKPASQIKTAALTACYLPAAAIDLIRNAPESARQITAQVEISLAKKARRRITAAQSSGDIYSREYGQDVGALEVAVNRAERVAEKLSPEWRSWTLRQVASLRAGKVNYQPHPPD